MNKESKNSKFKRLANKRVPAALEKLDSIKKLSNKANYEYTDQEVIAIVKALDAKVKEVKNSFDKKTKPTFKI
tara:strand:- start:2867 stop:3085 length:219 start_codon:yes stop_codon:yes gene_type:complete